MSRIVTGDDRDQQSLLPPCLSGYVAEDNPVRVIEAFIDEIDLGAMKFEELVAASTGRSPP